MAKTLQEWGFRSSNGAQKRALRGFSTGCYLPRTRVNKARERAGSLLRDPALLITASGLLLGGRLLQACALLLLRLARGLASIFERHACKRFGPLREEALVGFVALLEDLEDLACELLVGVRLAPHALRKGLRYALGYLVVPLAGGRPVIGRYPGAILGALGIGLGDPAQVLEVRLAHRGRGHLIDTSVGVVVASSFKHIYLPCTRRG